MMSTSYFLICPLFTNIILWCLSVCSLFSLPFHKNRPLLQNLLIPKTILTPSNYDHEYLTISCHWLPLSMNTAEGILQKLSSFPLNSLPAMRKQRVQVLRMSLYVFFVISSWSFPKQKKNTFSNNTEPVSPSLSPPLFLFLKRLTSHLLSLQRLTEKHKFGILKANLPKQRFLKLIIKCL